MATCGFAGNTATKSAISPQLANARCWGTRIASKFDPANRDTAPAKGLRTWLPADEPGLSRASQEQSSISDPQCFISILILLRLLDPRLERAKHHDSNQQRAIVGCTCLGGSGSFIDTGNFGHAHQNTLNSWPARAHRDGSSGGLAAWQCRRDGNFLFRLQHDELAAV